ncbi:MAG: hypothetical protein RMA76_43975 [Deltaproteobacteria bacterium]|jgi:hypothetical protein
MKWTLVILETPFRGAGSSPEERAADEARKVSYARACMRDCLLRHEAPYASHLLYTQPGVLDDRLASERSMGIDAGLAWGEVAQRTVVYEDLGISEGMHLGIERARREGRKVEFRTLPDFDVREDDRTDEPAKQASAT